MRLPSFLLLAAGLALASLPQVFGQTTPAPANPHPNERMPIFPGGDSLDWNSSAQRLKKFIVDNLRVPTQAVRDQVAGRVFVSFVVLPDGHTGEIRLVKGLRADVDSAVLTAVRRLRQVQWRPGTQDGRPVRVGLTAPISIGLPAGFGGRTDSLDLPRFRNPKLPSGSWNLGKAPRAGAGVIYGSCLQRLGFSSGGLGQYVRLVNLTTGQTFRLSVKPILRSRRENPFCYALPAGRYALSRYEFGTSGFNMQEEPLRKPADYAAGAGAGVAATRFVFVVQPGRLHYVGTWNFANANEPTFLDEKYALDPVLQVEFPGARLPEAVVALPQ